MTADEATVLLAAAKKNAAGERCVLATVVATKGSTPRKPGARLLVLGAGDEAPIGTIGGGRIEHEIIEAARALLHASGDDAHTPKLVRFHLTHDLAMCCGGEMDVFLEPLGRKTRVVLVGGGHIHQALAPILLSVGFEVTVVDDLEELASEARFPGARLVSAWDPRTWGVPFGDDTLVVVATRDHAVDQDVLEALAKHGPDVRWVGVVGSEGKLGRFRKRLLARGVDEAFVKRLRGPVGVAIAAETPAEIAVSIAAELVAVHRGATVA